MTHFIKGLWPQSLFTWLGLIMGAMSVLKLIEVSFAYQFVPNIAGVLDAYEQILKRIVEIELPWWAGPFIHQLVAWVRDWLGIDITLHAHWKHVFVLTGVYVFRNIAPPFRRGHPHTGVFNIVWGGLIALSSSIGSGSIALSQHDARANFLVAAIPVVGGFIYETGRGVWGMVFHRGTRADIYGTAVASPLSYLGAWMTKLALRSGSLAVLLVVGLLGGAFALTPSPGVAMYGVVTLAFALILVGEGLWDTRSLKRKPGEGWFEAFGRTYQGGHGLAMLGVFFQAFIIVGINELLREHGV